MLLMILNSSNVSMFLVCSPCYSHRCYCLCSLTASLAARSSPTRSRVAARLSSPSSSWWQGAASSALSSRTMSHTPHHVTPNLQIFLQLIRTNRSSLRYNSSPPLYFSGEQQPPLHLSRQTRVGRQLPAGHVGVRTSF